MKSAIGLCLVLLVPLGCAKDGGTQVDSPASKPDIENTEPSDSNAEEPVVKTDKELNPFPSMPMSQLLGKERAFIETLFYPSKPGHGPDWVKYNEDMELRYKNGVCVEMKIGVRGGLKCREAAVWAGFGAAMAPIYKPKSCVWPPNSLKHSLGKGVCGELLLQGGILTARLN